MLKSNIDSQCPVSFLRTHQVTTLSNFNFWHNFHTINLADKGTRLNRRVPLFFHFNRNSAFTDVFPISRLSPKTINTSPAMLACCNWQHIHFCQIDGAGSIPVTDTVASIFLTGLMASIGKLRKLSRGPRFRPRTPFQCSNRTQIPVPSFILRARKISLCVPAISAILSISSVWQAIGLG